jgi:hypothetical protein
MKEMQQSFLSFQSTLEKEFSTFTSQESSFQQSFSQSVNEWKTSLLNTSNTFSQVYQKEQIKNQEILAKKAKEMENVRCHRLRFLTFFIAFSLSFLSALGPSFFCSFFLFVLPSLLLLDNLFLTG